MSLEEKIKQWASSPAGKKKIQQARGNALRTGKSFGHRKGNGGGSPPPDNPDRYAEELIQILKEKISFLGFEFGDYLRVESKYFDEQAGQWRIAVGFDPEKIHRDSLQPDWFPEGAYDIVALINKGYDIPPGKSTIRGYWDTAGTEVYALRHREGAHYIQDAADKFNSKFEGEAYVSWHPKYD